MSPQDIQFSIDVGFKADPIEAQYEGQPGLFVEGYATRFGVVDKQDEWTDPSSFSTAARTFFKSDRNGPVPLIYEHGFDPVLLTTRLGRVIDHKIDDVGVWVKGFLPRPEGVLDEVGEKALSVYNAVKSGAIHAFSIGGCFGRIGREIARVGLYEISLTERPVLPSATFAVAQKSLPAVALALEEGSGADVITNPLDDAESFMGALHGFVRELAMGQGQKAWPKGKQMPPWMAEKVDAARSGSDGPPKPDGVAAPRHNDTVQHGLSRDGHAAAMKVAVRDKSQALHDHLLDPLHHAPEAQSAHDPETCPICQNRRDQQGIKATPDGAAAAATPCACDCACPGCTCPGTPTPTSGPGGKALSPGQLPHHMTELAALALEVSQLHALSTAEDGERAELVPGTDVKAGKTLSGLSMQTLRAFASQVTAAGQALHEWLDKNQPEPDPAAFAPSPATAGPTPAQKKQAAMTAATGKS